MAFGASSVPDRGQGGADVRRKIQFYFDLNSYRVWWKWNQYPLVFVRNRTLHLRLPYGIVDIAVHVSEKIP